MDRVLAQLAPHLSSGARVLDVGAGPGYLSSRWTRSLASVAPSVVLLDAQRDMWSEPRRGARPPATARSFARVVADATELPFRSSSVDVVLSVGVLCCLTEAAIPGAVAETARVLRPGGWLVFGVPRRRAAADEARWERAGFRVAASERPGRTRLQKTH